MVLIRLVAVQVFAFALASGSAFAWDEPFCALSVRVADPNGTPKAGVSVEVLKLSSEIEITALTDDAGKAKICDWGFGPREVVVGRRSCYPVRFTIQRILEKHPIELTAVLNPCTRYPTERNYCVISLRIVDSQGKSIENAAVSPRYANFPDRSDRFGRMWVYVLHGMSVDLAVSAEGYEAQNKHIQCKETELIEGLVTLESVR